MDPVFQELSYTTRRMIKAENATLKEFGITYSQWVFMVYLHKHKATPLVAIARHYMIKKPVVTAIKKSLLEKSWIKEETGRDQREKLISLSSEGEQHFTRINKKIRTMEKNFIQPLNAKEQSALQEMLYRLNRKGTAL